MTLDNPWSFMTPILLLIQHLIPRARSRFISGPFYRFSEGYWMQDELRTPDDSVLSSKDKKAY